MCIFSREPAKVSGTKIVVARVVNQPKQMTIYSNIVQGSEQKPTAMILPFPSINGSSVEFLPLKDATFFDEYEKFHRPTVQSKSLDFSETNSIHEPLHIIKVGSYDCCVVPSLDQLCLLPGETFGFDGGKIPKDIQNLLENAYANDGKLSKQHGCSFGFIVCKIRMEVKPQNYHPIAYTHTLLPKGLFVPTRHSSHVDWDHDIYAQGHENEFPSYATNLKEVRIKFDKCMKINKSYCTPNRIQTMEKMVGVRFFDLKNLDKSEDSTCAWILNSRSLKNDDLLI